MYRDSLVIYIDETPRAQTISKIGQEFSKLGCLEAQVTMQVGWGQGQVVRRKGKVRTPPPTRAALLLLIYESSVKV